MSTVLITGINGFVGSAVARRFQAAGWHVLGISRTPVPELAENHLSWDLSSEPSEALENWFRRSDVVVHAAARSMPWGRRSWFHRANAVATQHVRSLCERCGHPDLIHLSTAAVYYRPCHQWNLTEASPFSETPVNHYAASKQQAERSLNGYGGRLVVLRPRAIYGVGDSVLFPRILKAADAGRFPLIQSDSPVVGDLISIRNLVDCIYRASTDTAIRGSWNLTDGDPVAIQDFLGQVFRQLGIPRPTRQVKFQKALLAAQAIETCYALFRPGKEPPITTFGVQAFAYSKTFDVSRMYETFGAPGQTTDQAVSEFVEWVQREDPYGLMGIRKRPLHADD